MRADPEDPSTKFYEYRGGVIEPARGGVPRIVEGIEFWDHGSPDVPYKIIGVIVDVRPDGLVTSPFREKSVAAQAKLRNSDAVIVSEIQREARSINQSGHVKHTQTTKYLAVKYQSATDSDTSQ